MNSLSFSPKPVLTRQGGITIVRDDLLPGGTKQRACGSFLEDMMRLGKRHFIYASPFAGFAQVALAYVSQMLDVSCTLFCERDQRFEDDRLHPFSLLAQSYGASVILVESLAKAQEKTFALSRIDSQSMQIPLGFDCPEFRIHLEKRISESVAQIEDEVGHLDTIWMPIGSGTLMRSFLNALPERIKFKCVNVRILETSDVRIETIRNNPRVQYFEAPMTFHTEAQDLPSIPSNIFYDAKLWAFIKKDAQLGDLWWNVAQ
jgi:hypothetical protein